MSFTEDDQQSGSVVKVLPSGSDTNNDDIYFHIFKQFGVLDCINLKLLSRGFSQQARFRLRTIKITSLTLEVNYESLRLWIHSGKDEEFVDFFYGTHKKTELKAYRQAFTAIASILQECNGTAASVWINLDGQAFLPEIPRLRVPNLKESIKIDYIFWPVTGPIDFYKNLEPSVTIELYECNPPPRKYRTKSELQMIDEIIEEVDSSPRI